MKGVLMQTRNQIARVRCDLKRQHVKVTTVFQRNHNGSGVFWNIIPLSWLLKYEKDYLNHDKVVKIEIAEKIAIVTFIY